MTGSSFHRLRELLREMSSIKPSIDTPHNILMCIRSCLQKAYENIWQLLSGYPIVGADEKMQSSINIFTGFGNSRSLHK